MGGLTKLCRISAWVTESGRAPSAVWGAKMTWSWSQARWGAPGARARALKQWSQLQTLSIQCLDLSTAGRRRNPDGVTVADHRTEQASSAAGGRAPRPGAT